VVPMTATCPVCGCEQGAGLLCNADTSRLERELGDVAALVEDLEIAMSKQARLTEGSGGPAGMRPATADQESGASRLAHERMPIHLGAIQAADDLANCLTSWARDVAGTVPWAKERNPSVAAAAVLLSHIPEIRRHPAVEELVDGIEEATSRARGIVLGATNRTVIFVGPCPELTMEGHHCEGEIYAYFPSETNRPPRMECRADKEHKWTAIQWLRTGKRILDRIEERKRGAA